MKLLNLGDGGPMPPGDGATGVDGDTGVQGDVGKTGPYVRWEALAHGQSGDIELERAWLRHCGRTFEIFCRKQRSYGPMNIAEFGERGVILRANDKLKRLINLRYHGVDNPLDDETVEDTWIDLADYGLIGLLCYTGEWPYLGVNDDR